jgi:ABC-type Fe3+/spermidine/putrescine transport system ATPase subunit
MLSLRNVSKRYGEFALQDVTFEVAAGESVALLGPSGSGKSTLLNLVAGLEAPDGGQILWDSQDLAGVPPHQRHFGLMFQDYALFPHRDVFGNVAFGLEMQHWSPADISERVAQMLELVGLPDFAKRPVDRLSGGEQQRVALARALAPRPRLLMLDEPFGALDRGLRERLLADLAGILAASGQTSLYVTHDQEEAFAIADRIVLLQAGRVAQVGAPEALYGQPASEFVARFLGLDNILPATALSAGGRTVLDTPLGRFPSPDEEARGAVRVLFRPDAVEWGHAAEATLEGVLRQRQFRGNTVWAEVEVQGQRMRFEFPSQAPLPALGQPIVLSFNPREALQILHEEGH